MVVVVVVLVTCSEMVVDPLLVAEVGLGLGVCVSKRRLELVKSWWCERNGDLALYLGSRVKPTYTAPS